MSWVLSIGQKSQSSTANGDVPVWLTGQRKIQKLINPSINCFYIILFSFVYTCSNCSYFICIYFISEDQTTNCSKLRTVTELAKFQQLHVPLNTDCSNYNVVSGLIVSDLCDSLPAVKDWHPGQRVCIINIRVRFTYSRHVHSRYKPRKRGGKNWWYNKVLLYIHLHNHCVYMQRLVQYTINFNWRHTDKQVDVQGFL
jgi:hypothetical protein